MLVKFSNTEVPIYKVRQGVVIGWYSGTTYFYGHVTGILVRGDNTMLVIQFQDYRDLHIPTKDLDWLEPH